jgi:class 3 adenylate cyclase
LHSGGVLQAVLLLLENVVRTSILLVGYWVFEMGSQPANAQSLSVFLSSESHIFIALATLFLGLILGFANFNAQSYLERLREAATRLRQFSEWLLGRTLLDQALQDPDALALRRQERAILFMDIRGFTHWSECEAPEQVVKMLNAYFERSEQALARNQTIKTKNSGDEIMAIFPNGKLAAQAALDLQNAVAPLLEEYGLAAGIGVHCGPVVEGVMGSREVKGYDVVGDAVNTAKRICDQAGGGEVLVSQAVQAYLPEHVRVVEQKLLALRGKDDALQVFAIRL